MTDKSVEHINDRQVGNFSTMISVVGDYFDLVTSRLPLTIKFYSATGECLGTWKNLYAFSFDFKRQGDGKQFVQFEVVSPNGNCTPSMIVATGMTPGAIRADGAYSITATPKQVMADTDTYTVGARAGRKRLQLRSDQDSDPASVIWTGGALGVGLPLYPGESIPYDDWRGAVTLYSQGANTLYIEETY